jgi:hypothetical protein
MNYQLMTKNEMLLTNGGHHGVAYRLGRAVGFVCAAFAACMSIVVEAAGIADSAKR